MKATKTTLRRFLISLAAFTCVVMAGTPLRAQLTMEDIIENVRRNEALYDNIDVTLITDYGIGDQKPMDFGNGMSQLVSLDTRIRFVSQDGLFRFDRTRLRQAWAMVIAPNSALPQTRKEYV